MTDNLTTNNANGKRAEIDVKRIM